jgi:hypothetical protein
MWHFSPRFVQYPVDEFAPRPPVVVVSDNYRRRYPGNEPERAWHDEWSRHEPAIAWCFRHRAHVPLAILQLGTPVHGSPIRHSHRPAQGEPGDHRARSRRLAPRLILPSAFSPSSSTRAPAFQLTATISAAVARPVSLEARERQLFAVERPAQGDRPPLDARRHVHRLAPRSISSPSRALRTVPFARGEVEQAPALGPPGT